MTARSWRAGRVCRSRASRFGPHPLRRPWGTVNRSPSVRAAGTGVTSRLLPVAAVAGPTISQRIVDGLRALSISMYAPVRRVTVSFALLPDLTTCVRPLAQSRAADRQHVLLAALVRDDECRLPGLDDPMGDVEPVVGERHRDIRLSRLACDAGECDADESERENEKGDQNTRPANPP